MRRGWNSDMNNIELEIALNQQYALGQADERARCKEILEQSLKAHKKNNYHGDNEGSMSLLRGLIAAITK